jgi:hypothetical protein
MKLLITLFSPTPYYFFPLWSKHSPQHPADLHYTTLKLFETIIVDFVHRPSLLKSRFGNCLYLCPQVNTTRNKRYPVELVHVLIVALSRGLTEYIFYFIVFILKMEIGPVSET